MLRNIVDEENILVDIEVESRRWLIEGTKEEVIERLNEEIDSDVLEEIYFSSEHPNEDNVSELFQRLMEEVQPKRRPEEVLLAIYALRMGNPESEIPPRKIEEVFTDNGLKPPGNLSLYINRLKEKGLLSTPGDDGQQNRFAKLTEKGLQHLGI